MNSRFRCRLGRAQTLVAAALVFCSGNTIAVSYSFIALGDVGLVQADSGSAINNAGQVVGSGVLETETSAHREALRWEGGTGARLNGGAVGSWATDINNAGQAVGTSYYLPHKQRVATVWGASEAVLLSSLSGAKNSLGFGINSQGHVVGSTEFGDPALGTFATHATVWNGTEPVDLDPNGTFSSARAVNDAGQIVGYRQVGGMAMHATLWNGTDALDLGASWDTFSTAHAINNAGQIVGSFIRYDGWIPQAVVWDGLVPTMLGTLGGTGSDASDINEKGQIVGRSHVAGNGEWHATLWDGTTAIDLNDYLTEAQRASGVVLVSASGISDNGWIVGHYSLGGDGAWRPFVLAVSAVPEPQSSLMFFAGTCVVWCIRTRRLGRGGDKLARDERLSEAALP